MLNGAAVISIGGQNNTSGSNSIILPLNRGDQVWMELFKGQLVELNDLGYEYLKCAYLQITLLKFIDLEGDWRHSLASKLMLLTAKLSPVAAIIMPFPLTKMMLKMPLLSHLLETIIPDGVTTIGRKVA